MCYVHTHTYSGIQLFALLAWVSWCSWFCLWWLELVFLFMVVVLAKESLWKLKTVTILFNWKTIHFALHLESLIFQGWPHPPLRLSTKFGLLLLLGFFLIFYLFRLLLQNKINTQNKYLFYFEKKKGGGRTRNRTIFLFYYEWKVSSVDWQLRTNVWWFNQPCRVYFRSDTISLFLSRLVTRCIVIIHNNYTQLDIDYIRYTCNLVESNW